MQKVLSKPDNPREQAFTLLEIMIALAIIGIGLTALLGLGNRIIGVNDRLQNVTQATLLAQQKMAENELLVNQEGLAQFRENSGTFAAPFSRYRWQTSVSETPLPTVKQVTVTVLWGDPKQNESIDVTSFLF